MNTTNKTTTKLKKENGRPIYHLQAKVSRKGFSIKIMSRGYIIEIKGNNSPSIEKVKFRHKRYKKFDYWNFMFDVRYCLPRFVKDAFDLSVNRFVKRYIVEHITVLSPKYNYYEDKNYQNTKARVPK